MVLSEKSSIEVATLEELVCKFKSMNCKSRQISLIILCFLVSSICEAATEFSISILNKICTSCLYYVKEYY